MESILMLTKDNEQYNCQVEHVKKPNEVNNDSPTDRSFVNC